VFQALEIAYNANVSASSGGSAACQNRPHDNTDIHRAAAAAAAAGSSSNNTKLKHNKRLLAFS